MGTSASKSQNHVRSDTNTIEGNGLLSPAALNSLLPHNFRNTTKCQAPPPLPPPGETPPTPPLPKSQSAPPPPAAPPSESTPPPPADSISSAIQSVEATTYTNPGPYEHLTGSVRGLTTLDAHDGARINISKQLSPYMNIVHSFWLGTTMIPEKTKSYSCVAQVADESGRFLYARVDPDRKSVDGRLHSPILGGLAMGKIILSVSEDGQSDQLLGDVDLGGETFTANLKYGSAAGGKMYGVNYLQALTPNLSVGGEGLFIEAQKACMANYTASYSGTVTRPSSVTPDVWEKGSGDYQAIGTYNAAQQTVGLYYKRVVTPKRVTLGAELQCQAASLESTVVLGAEFQLTRSKMSMTLDGTGKIQSVLETKLGMAPGSPSLSFTGEVDHGNDSMRFGYGMNIGG